MTIKVLKIQGAVIYLIVFCVSAAGGEASCDLWRLACFFKATRDFDDPF